MKQRIAKFLLAMALIGIMSGCTTSPDHIVNFVTNEGTPIASISGKAGTKITDEIVTTREGYKFLGWYSDEALTKRVTSIVTYPYADVTLYARWGKIVSVDFDTRQGSKKESIVGVEGETIDFGEDPIRESYYFVSWHTSPDFSDDTRVTFSSFPNTDITLYAEWEAYPTISFDSNYVIKDGESTGDLKIPSVPVPKGADLSTVTFPTELLELTKLDEADQTVKFEGWFIESVNDDGTVSSKQFYLNGSMPDHSIALVGRWSNLRTITYNTQVEGQSVPTASFYAGHALSAPDRPQNPGYYLVGWFEKGPDGNYLTEPFAFRVMPDYDVTLYAVWSENPVVTFTDGFLLDNDDLNEILMAERILSFEVGTKISEPEGFADAHQGYTLIGWFIKNGETYSRFNLNSSEAYIDTADLVLYARYAKTTATVRFFDPSSSATEPIASFGLNYADPSDISASSIDSSDCPTIPSKVIIDWYSAYDAAKNDFIGNPVSFPYASAEDVNLYAKTVDEVTLTLKIENQEFTLVGGATLNVSLSPEIQTAYTAFAANYQNVSWFVESEGVLTSTVYDLKTFPEANMTLVLRESDTPFNPDIDI